MQTIITRKYPQNYDAIGIFIKSNGEPVFSAAIPILERYLLWEDGKGTVELIEALSQAIAKHERSIDNDCFEMDSCPIFVMHKVKPIVFVVVSNNDDWFDCAKDCLYNYLNKSCIHGGYISTVIPFLSQNDVCINVDDIFNSAINFWYDTADFEIEHEVILVVADNFKKERHLYKDLCIKDEYYPMTKNFVDMAMSKMKKVFDFCFDDEDSNDKGHSDWTEEGVLLPAVIAFRVFELFCMKQNITVYEDKLYEEEESDSAYCKNKLHKHKEGKRELYLTQQASIDLPLHQDVIELYKRAGVTSNDFNLFRYGQRITKKNIEKLSLALKLDLCDAEELLAAAGYGLCPEYAVEDAEFVKTIRTRQYDLEIVNKAENTNLVGHTYNAFLNFLKQSRVLNMFAENNTSILHNDEDEEKLITKHITKVYQKAKIDRREFSRFKNGKYVSKTVLIRLVIALELNERDAKKLLNCCGYAISQYVPGDVVFITMLKSKRYDIDEIVWRLESPMADPFGFYLPYYSDEERY